MKINIIKIEQITIAEIISETAEIKEAQDALDIIGNSIYQGTHKIIIYEAGLSPAFFNLKTGIAGEILQKFSNYKAEVAIIGDFSKYPSESLQALITESNKNGQINFVNSLEEAKTALLKNPIH